MPSEIKLLNLCEFVCVCVCKLMHARFMCVSGDIKICWRENMNEKTGTGEVMEGMQRDNVL